jgi:hypothetical protein
MQTLTQEQFKKKYGDSGLSLFQPSAPVPKEDGYVKRVTDTVGQDIYDRSLRMNEILGRKDSSVAEKALQFTGQGAGLAAKTLETTVGEIPGVKQVLGVVGSGINWLATSNLSPIKHLGDLIGSSKTLQEATMLYDSDKNFKDSVDGVANLVRLGMDIEVAKDTTNFAKNVTNKIVGKITTPTIKAGGKTLTLDQIHTPSGQKFIDSLPKEQQQLVSAFDNKNSLLNQIKTQKALGKDVTDLQNTFNQEFGVKPVADAVESSSVSANTAKNIAKDIIPSRERLVNTEVTKALDLTQADVRNISLSTGNDTGAFLADNNLIGVNVAETSSNLQKFLNENYTRVRTEVGSVKEKFRKTEIPTYYEALGEIKKQITDVPGLQADNYIVDALLKKKILSLEDVQQAKELMDKHFSLYKVVGDVKEGVAKTGLANIRGSLKSFIENKVKNNTGADISDLNNNVATARSIQDAIETRSTRGMTRANVSAGDIVTFLTGSGLSGGNPLIGLVAVLAKKIYQSPAFKLRFAKFLDGLNDSRKLKVLEDLKAGKLPPEIKIQSGNNSSSQPKIQPKNPTTQTTKKTKKSLIP